MARQTNRFRAQVAVDGVSALVARGFANAELRSPAPDYLAWQIADDIARQKTEDFWSSLLVFGVRALILAL
jgi:hypothetical protein